MVSRQGNLTAISTGRVITTNSGHWCLSGFLTGSRALAPLLWQGRRIPNSMRFRLRLPSWTRTARSAKRPRLKGLSFLAEQGARAALTNETARRNLCQAAQAREVPADRLVFAEYLPLAEHLARHRLADLFLDTLPYGAHVTASDALWAGLPVLTCAGRSFASRVAGSLLHAVGLPELVTQTLDEYEALALRLASDPQLLGALRGRLADNRLTAPLFDSARHCRHLEDAYQEVHDRWHRGEPAQSFAVAPRPI
jgi:hypothetical protein